MAFRLSENNGFTYIGRHTADLDSLLSGGSSAPTLTDTAEDIIRDMLAEGECPAADIYKAAEEVGIGKDTLGVAKRRLGVKSKKKGDNWLWLLT